MELENWPVLFYHRAIPFKSLRRHARRANSTFVVPDNFFIQLSEIERQDGRVGGGGGITKLLLLLKLIYYLLDYVKRVL